MIVSNQIKIGVKIQLGGVWVSQTVLQCYTDPIAGTLKGEGQALVCSQSWSQSQALNPMVSQRVTDTCGGATSPLYI